MDPPKRIAGYFKLDRTYDASLFYFFFEARSPKPNTPVVLWMNGGPGCSSELAVFFENGPYHINKDLSLSETEFGWDNENHVLYVDQPVNTGFSYSDDPRDTVHNEDGVSADMLDFLQEFFAAHPDIADNDFYVTGESYAGHYVPAVSHRVWLAKKKGEGKPINIRGLAIGNGLTDPIIQYGAYADYAYMNKLIDSFSHTLANLFVPVCQFGASYCNSTHSSIICSATWYFCQAAIVSPIMSANDGMNVYDIRKPCVGRLCYDFSNMEELLSRPDTRAALGVGQHKWQECNMDVYFEMIGDWMVNYDQLLPELLEDGVRVLVYAGEDDFICNWLGNRRWVEALQWAGAAQWRAAPDDEWEVAGKKAGQVHEWGPLTFLKVYDAGHMVPMDQPAAALDMINRFISDQKFAPASATVETKRHGHSGQSAVAPARRLLTVSV